MSSSNFQGNPNNLLSQTYIVPDDIQERSVKLSQYLNLLSISVNSKDSGIYDSIETVTGRQFLPVYGTTKSSNATYRPVLRKVIDFGALPNNTTKSVAHGISTNENFSFVNIYATATDPGASTVTESLPIPYASSTAANNIEINVDATNINITTGSDRTAFTRCFVVLEWIQTT